MLAVYRVVNCKSGVNAKSDVNSLSAELKIGVNSELAYAVNRVRVHRLNLNNKSM